MLRKWTAREKYVKYQNFPTPFSLLLSRECSGEISRKSVEYAYPINSLKVDVFLLESYARFSLVKRDSVKWGCGRRMRTADGQEKRDKKIKKDIENIKKKIIWQTNNEKRQKIEIVIALIKMKTYGVALDIV